MPFTLSPKSCDMSQRQNYSKDCQLSSTCLTILSQLSVVPKSYYTAQCSMCLNKMFWLLIFVIEMVWMSEIWTRMIALADLFIGVCTHFIAHSPITLNLLKNCLISLLLKVLKVRDELPPLMMTDSMLCARAHYSKLQIVIKHAMNKFS